MQKVWWHAKPEVVTPGTCAEEDGTDTADTVLSILQGIEIDSLAPCSPDLASESLLGVPLPSVVTSNVPPSRSCLGGGTAA